MIERLFTGVGRAVAARHGRRAARDRRRASARSTSPRRLPLRSMARFSRLPVLAPGVGARARAAGHRRRWARRAWHPSSTSSSDGRRPLPSCRRSRRGDPHARAGGAHRRGAPRRRACTSARGSRGVASAGHALVVVARARDRAPPERARSMHKSAYNQPDGLAARRRARVSPARSPSVSDALLLDRPREGVQAAARHDRTTTRSTPSSSRRRTTPATTAPVATPKPTAARSASNVHAEEEAAASGSPATRSSSRPATRSSRAVGRARAIEPVGRVDGRVATGLARPDVFNWFTQIARRQVEGASRGPSCSCSAATTTRRT